MQVIHTKTGGKFEKVRWRFVNLMYAKELKHFGHIKKPIRFQYCDSSGIRHYYY